MVSNSRVTLKDLLERQKKWQITQKQEELVVSQSDNKEIEKLSQNKEITTKTRKKGKKTITATPKDTEKASVPEERSFMVANEDELKKEISE